MWYHYKNCFYVNESDLPTEIRVIYGYITTAENDSRYINLQFSKGAPSLMLIPSEATGAQTPR